MAVKYDLIYRTEQNDDSERLLLRVRGYGRKFAIIVVTGLIFGKYFTAQNPNTCDIF